MTSPAQTPRPDKFHKQGPTPTFTHWLVLQQPSTGLYTLRPLSKTVLRHRNDIALQGRWLKLAVIVNHMSRMSLWSACQVSFSSSIGEQIFEAKYIKIASLPDRKFVNHQLQQKMLLISACVCHFVFSFVCFWARQPPPPVGQGVLIHEICRSHSDTPQSLGLLWASDQLVAETSTR